MSEFKTRREKSESHVCENDYASKFDQSSSSHASLVTQPGSFASHATGHLCSK